MATLASVIRAIGPSSSRRRSIPPTSIGTSGAETAATRLGTVTISPAVPSETPSADPTAVSSPIGSCSAVTSRNVPSATALTAAQRLLGGAWPSVVWAPDRSVVATGTLLRSRSLLREGRRNGELPTGLDLDAAVELLFTTLLGLRVRHRAGHDLARLTTAIDAVIRSLGPAPEES